MAQSPGIITSVHDSRRSAVVITAARICFFAGVLAVSVLPRPWKGRLKTVGQLHMWSHIAVFFVGTLLIVRRNWSVSGFLAAGASLALFGILLEILQTRVYHNLLET